MLAGLRTVGKGRVNLELLLVLLYSSKKLHHANLTTPTSKKCLYSLCFSQIRGRVLSGIECCKLILTFTLMESQCPM